MAINVYTVQYVQDDQFTECVVVELVCNDVVVDSEEINLNELPDYPWRRRRTLVEALQGTHKEMLLKMSKLMLIKNGNDISQLRKKK